MGRLQAAGYPLAFIDDHAAWLERFERALRELPAARRASSSLPILAQYAGAAVDSEAAADRRLGVPRALQEACAPQGLADIPQLDVRTSIGTSRISARSG